MARHPGLMRRSARWYLRSRVPQDRTGFLGRDEIWRSLQTGDHREAVRRYTRARADLQTWFDQQRSRRDAGEKLNGEAPRLVASWFHESERQAAHVDFGLVGDDLIAALCETDQALTDLLSDDAGEDVAAAIEKTLLSAGWPARAHVVGEIATRRVRIADAPEDHRAALAGLVHRALIEAARRRRDRLNGIPARAVDPLFSGSAPLQPVANGPAGAADNGLTLAKLTERWLAERAAGISAKTVIEYRALFRVLGETWGEHCPIRRTG